MIQIKKIQRIQNRKTQLIQINQKIQTNSPTNQQMILIKNKKILINQKIQINKKIQINQKILTSLPKEDKVRDNLIKVAVKLDQEKMMMKKLMKRKSKRKKKKNQIKMTLNIRRKKRNLKNKDKQKKKKKRKLFGRKFLPSVIQIKNLKKFQNFQENLHLC